MKLLMFLVFIWASPSFAMTLDGSVARKGLGRKVQVTIAMEDKTFLLCHSELTLAVSKLSRMKVRIEGDWQKESECFEPKSMDVLELVNGSRAVSGILQKNGRQYSIKAKTETFPIAIPSEGLMKMMNQKVIVELNAATNKKGELSYRVGSYMAWPKF